MINITSYSYQFLQFILVMVVAAALGASKVQAQQDATAPAATPIAEAPKADAAKTEAAKPETSKVEGKKKSSRKAKAKKTEAKVEAPADSKVNPEAELGQTAEPTTAPTRADGIVAPGEVLIFKVDPSDDGSRNGEVREPIRFSAPDADFGTGKMKATDSGLAEEAPFKAYIGYPKHQIGAIVSPINISSKFNYNGRAFNFKSSSLAYGLWYRLIATPLVNLNLDWNRFSAGVAATTISPYTIADSDQTYDNYSVSGSYCFTSKSSFYHRVCPGFKIANDSYPILEFVSGTNLEMSKVEDIVLGLTVDYQFPVVESLLLTAMAGYNYGTGVGNSGNLTSKENNAIYGRVGSAWTLGTSHEITGNIEYNMRTANLKGLVGSNEDKWKTTSTVVGFRLGYGYTF